MPRPLANPRFPQRYAQPTFSMTAFGGDVRTSSSSLGAGRLSLSGSLTRRTGRQPHKSACSTKLAAGPGKNEGEIERRRRLRAV